MKYFITLLILFIFLQSCNTNKSKFVDAITNAQVGDSINIDRLFDEDIKYMYIIHEYTRGEEVSGIVGIDKKFDDVNSVEQCLVFIKDNNDYIELRIFEGEIPLTISNNLIREKNSQKEINKSRRLSGVIYNEMRINKYIFIKQKYKYMTNRNSTILSNSNKE